MQSNIETIRLLYSRFASADYEAVKELLSANIVWEQMPGFPNGGTYTGADEVITQVFGELKQGWQVWKAVVHAYVAGEGFVFVQGHYEGIYRKTGKAMKADFLHQYQLRNNKVVHFKQYTDTQLIAAAMSEAYQGGLQKTNLN